MTAFVLTPLPAPLPVLDPLPAGAQARVVDTFPGYPCRRCLQDARPGERVVLLSYDPFLGDGPYRQAGPVYVHEQPCEPPARAVRDGAALPEQLTRRVLSVRSFGADHLLRGAAVTPGRELARVAGELLDGPDVAYLHVHFAAPGCFAVRIDRTGEAPDGRSDRGSAGAGRRESALTPAG